LPLNYPESKCNHTHASRRRAEIYIIRAESDAWEKQICACVFLYARCVFAWWERWSIKCMVGDKKRHIQNFTSARANFDQKVGGCTYGGGWCCVLGACVSSSRNLSLLCCSDGGERTKRQGKAIKLCAVNLSQWPHAAPLAVLQTLLIPQPA
jgi:hypothetical protein